MLTTLTMLAVTRGAEADPAGFEGVGQVFASMDTLAHPDRLVPALQQMSVIWALIFVIAGLVAMINGFKLYKWVTVVLALALGVFGGYFIGKSLEAEYVVAGCLGVLLAVCCWPLMKFAVAVMGGIVGAFLGANLWGAAGALINDPSTKAHVAATSWVGGLMGLIILGMLAFLLFKLTVVIFTSVSGATLAMLGTLALLVRIQGFREAIPNWYGPHKVNVIVLPLLAFVPAIIGLVLQHHAHGKGGAAAPSGSGGSAKPAAKAA
jgi:hypothetical protein